MALLSFPATVDDAGLGQDGTVFNAAYFAAIKSAIEAVVHSTTNPSLTPEDIIDEVVNARGSTSSLDQRLDVALNEDGTLKTIGGTLVQTDLQNTLGIAAGNLLVNNDFQIWADGDSAIPQSWAVASGSPTISRAGTGLADTNRKIGDFCLKLVTAAENTIIRQTILPGTDFDRAGALFEESREFGIGCWVKTSTPNIARIKMNDGGNFAISSSHTGSGNWEWLSAAGTAQSGTTGTALLFDFQIDTAATVYFSMPTVLIGKYAPPRAIPSQVVYGTLAFLLPGDPVIASQESMHYVLARPGIVRDVAIIAKTDVGSNLVLAIERRIGTDTWESLYTSNPTVTTGNRFLYAGAPTAAYERRCFRGIANDRHDNTLRVRVVTAPSSGGQDVGIMVRVMQYQSAVEQFRGALSI